MRQTMLVAPDGSLVPDQRRAWFSPPPWALPDPFAPVGPAGTPAASVLLAGRYAVRQAIRHSFSGGVFRATDQRTGAPVIIKQARPHTGADLTGRDACDLRRHEADMLRLLASSGAVARLVDVFDQQGDLFLVQEEINGLTLRDWVSRHLV